MDSALELKREEFEEMIDRYTRRDLVREDFFEVTHELAEYKLPRTQMESVPMLDYKKVIVNSIEKKNQKENFYNFTDEELVENRIKNNKELLNMKITKILVKDLKDATRFSSTQIVDYFHKLPNENETYYISGEPNDLLKAYTEVSTCISPDGDNIADMFQFLVSPVIHIAFTGDFKSRVMVFLDKQTRTASIGKVYGKYNLMLEMSVMKWLIDNHYSLSKEPSTHFSVYQLFYYDHPYSDLVGAFEFMGGVIADELDPVSSKIQIFEKPDGKEENYKTDLITGGLNNTTSTTIIELRSSRGMLIEEDEEVCSNCGYVVDSDYYNYDYEMCENCYEEEPHCYCESCDENYHEENFDFEENSCIECAQMIIEEREAEEEADRLREEKLLEVLENGC
jgi:hypothetical protein